jgi:hypothetical protein
VGNQQLTADEIKAALASGTLVKLELSEILADYETDRTWEAWVDYYMMMSKANLIAQVSKLYLKLTGKADALLADTALNRLQVSYRMTKDDARRLLADARASEDGAAETAGVRVIIASIYPEAFTVTGLERPAP